ncbi:MAG: 50S ribosomal protein L20 [Deltaproteobacteria bacterium]|jgi:large subunit ribosomal protein L20|nr:50S ribosomal protein L20 [Deltaproteobacteria bacterium]
MRIKGGIQTKKTHKKFLKMAKGFRGGRRVLFRSAKGGVERGLKFAYRDRKVRKREMRSLWITRIGAAAKELGVSYSRLMDALNKAEIQLNRKVLSNIAAEDPAAFKGIVDKLKASALI